MGLYSTICGDSTALWHLIVLATRLFLLSLNFVPICMYSSSQPTVPVSRNYPSALIFVRPSRGRFRNFRNHPGVVSEAEKANVGSHQFSQKGIRVRVLWVVPRQLRPNGEGVWVPMIGSWNTRALGESGIWSPVFLLSFKSGFEPQSPWMWKPIVCACL